MFPSLWYLSVAYFKREKLHGNISNHTDVSQQK